MFERIINYLGVVPADWYQQLNDPQKVVFVSQTVIVLLFAMIIVWLLRSRGRVTGMPNDRIPRELWVALADKIHDELFDNWLMPDRITPKQYKFLCRLLEPKIPGLVGKLYTPAARKIMRERSQKYNAAQRINAMREERESGIVSGYSTFTRRIGLWLLKGDKPNKFTTAQKINGNN